MELIPLENYLYKKMELSGKQSEKLQKALIDAFRSKNKLEQMLYFELNKKLNEISTGDSLAEIVFELIKEAEAQNWIEELIIAAHRQNPGNELLKEFALKIAAQKEKSSQNQTDKIPKLGDIPTTGFEASEVGADYTPLKEILSRKDFKAADEETARMMLWVVRREKEVWLREEDIEKFPCRDLRTIDQLWLASSGGKFGFSVQKQIWIECGGKLGEHDYETMIKFYEYVEWKVGEEWVSYDNLCWDLRAHRGHLPTTYRRTGHFREFEINNLPNSTNWYPSISENKYYPPTNETISQDNETISEDEDDVWGQVNF